MSSNINPKKFKIIQFKDVVSLLLIVVIITTLTVPTFAFVSYLKILGVGYALTHIINTIKPSDIPETELARELAMFSSIVQVDLENIQKYSITVNTNSKKSLTFKENTMVTDQQLKTISVDTTVFDFYIANNNNNNNDKAYTFLFNNLASTSEVSNWKIVNYSKFKTSNSLTFTAMTFKNGNDIVIAYRGTDLALSNISTGLEGFLAQRDIAKNYAVNIAKQYAKTNNNVNIYLTGWSLGGYFAQLGGAALINNDNYKDNVKEISYFNSVGLDFIDDLTTIIENQKTLLNLVKGFVPSVSEIKNILDLDVKSDTKDYKILKAWHDNGGTIMSYTIDGDIISKLGKHAGLRKKYDAYTLCIRDNGGYNSKIKINFLTEKIINILDNELDTNVMDYMNEYGIADINRYFALTHKMDNFFGLLAYPDGSLPPNIIVKFSSEPSKLKKNKTDIIKLTITTTGGKLKSSSLSKNDFTVSNSKKLQITSVSKPTITYNNNEYKYKYELNVKSLKDGSNSTITLNHNKLQINKININNSYITQSIKNKFSTLKTYRLVSDTIE